MKNFKLKIIISVYLCLISLAFYNAVHSYNSSIDQAKSAAFSKLTTISHILSNQINGDMHQKLTYKYSSKDQIATTKQNYEYNFIHQILAKTEKSLNLNTPIYTLFKSSDKNKVYFGVTSSENPYYRHEYKSPPKELLENFDKGGFVDEYNDENGIWLSAYSPIINSKGETVAVVQADQNFKEFMLNVKWMLIKNISIVLIIYSAIGFLLYLFLKEILQKEENYTASQNNYNKELETQVDKRTKELNILNAKLKGVNNELSSFFYSTSHDIRGPLCRILGLSSLAKSEDDKQELVELIEIESQKMDDMLKKMILVNNLRTKNLQIEPVVIADMMNNILSVLNKKYRTTKAEITIQTETQSLNKFHSDTEILESIFTNILDNAFKFSDIKKPKININTFIDSNGILSLSISNNGIKFTKNEKEHAFELFKNKGQADGIRLGLYTIKTAVDKLNGIVSIEDQDQLTEIKVLIPDYYIIKDFELNMEYIHS
ncbi:MAG: HAMP domain-containing histidine kinase [Bacteroidetes bacterium]|nr:HAMP domain-containing histidine kinase [Bacteroidota bacterium]MBU1371635.1 HAMP domain-containing histidine kinase [Bacteroidota bacterium]MBU1486211.1 HAMP domain-containing histidine kinase [Bacteroidota bacterium]MBU1760156.1 HAMP domain-containing histidine kinase [Bacteroidota bacterium]MBU2047306.1 HAMP domain-containing histidine kinase [Bacteroidota bacterium]